MSRIDEPPAGRAVFAALLLGLTACQADLGVPPSARITCADDGCPPGMMCHVESSQCVTLVDRDVDYAEVRVRYGAD